MPLQWVVGVGGGGGGASEQLGNSFGSITPSFPMKVVGGHAHSSGRKSQASLVPRVTKVNFLLTVYIHNQEKMLRELLKWSPDGKGFDLQTNSLNQFFKEMYGA